MRKVKIVCTMGPATTGLTTLLELIEAGMDVARLNFSHGTHDDHAAMFKTIREAAAHSKKPIAILGDLCGPKIRVGDMKDGAIQLVSGNDITLSTTSCVGTPTQISHSYLPLSRDVKPGERILLDDGLIALDVIRVLNNTEVLARIVVGGTLKTKKGMNLPHTRLSIPALSEKDKADIAFGKQLGLDYFALSFVKTPADVMEAKSLAGDIPVIAKIEKPEAVACLDAILNVADGAMVARGDLGVEAGYEKVPLIQKRIIDDVKTRAKPVITATQMLESMIQNPTPTRAEVSDVANAVLDGTDAVMLSAETSIGKYPIEAVKMLASIIEEVERSDYYKQHLVRIEPQEATFSNAIAEAALKAANSLKLTAIAVYSESGKSAALVSANRPESAIICFSQHTSVLQRLALYWGIHPLHGDWVKGVDGVIEQAERELLAHNVVRSNDLIAITFGMVKDKEPFQTNMLRLWKIR